MAGNTIEEKRALHAKLSAELAEIEEDKMVQGLLEDIARGPTKRRDGTNRITARSVSQKYGYYTIPHTALRKVANILKVSYVTQGHYSDPDADYCGDCSYTWLEVGPPVVDRIKELKAEISRLEKM